MPTPGSADIGPSAANDFDFFIGNWRVQHRRLKQRLLACQEWEAFEGSSAAQKVLGGQGNLDDNLLCMAEGAYRAVTLRSFDAASGLWSIWWLDGRHPGRLDVPVVGGFSDASGERIGLFYADDTLNGQAIRVRFLWTPRSELGQPRWEQAFSVDGGLSWESNWVMDFSRLDAAPGLEPCL
ncbi:DUF1579 domain-containing protein [Roseateles oligotrophus]|uniref:DUF1579 domain-containing protein n=1 Tax=Roseateles oligotrophus TaxID=1769250 RepID=A0ABT2YD52_9BURK|nr:DUF1579 domain-containing protein [Roseateles oligotrophus]MCV2367967.1 DUF1579 domain-containing protein [Roseateles oligotrophus]